MALDTSPTTQDALSRIVQSYNAGLDVAMQLNDVDYVFETPIVNPDTAESIRNTRMRAKPTAVSGKYGRVTIYYNRMDMSAQTAAPIITRGTAVKISDVIPLINEYFGITLVANDYVDANLPAQVGALTLTSLAAKPGSLLFIGSLAFNLEAGAVQAIRSRPSGV